MNCRPTFFTKPFELPVTDGTGNNRDALRGALALLEQAGWKVRDRKLVDAEGQPFSFEILLDQPAFERVTLPYVQWLARLGIDARVRTVDPAQFQRLADTYDYDMIVVAIERLTESPGNRPDRLLDLRKRKAGGRLQPDGRLQRGDRRPRAPGRVRPDRAHLVVAAHALDRVLLQNWTSFPTGIYNP